MIKIVFVTNWDKDDFFYVFRAYSNCKVGEKRQIITYTINNV